VNIKKILIVFGIVLGMVYQAGAVSITVDGNINDWGLQNLTIGDWTNPSTWVPNIDGISFVIEDNQDPLNTMAVNYNASYTGVHIIGNRSFQDIYREPLLVGSRTEPYGGKGGKYGEEYDIEAMYVTENDTHIFVLVVFSTGLKDNKPYTLADLALNFWSGGGYGYEYGVNLHRINNEQGQLYGIYSTPDDDSWTVPAPFYENVPAEINFSTVDPSAALGTAIVAYADLGVSDHGRSNHIVEIAIPKDVVGNPDLPSDPTKAMKKFWLTEYCGNESIPSIAEFLTILIPAGFVIGFAGYMRRRG